MVTINVIMTNVDKILAGDKISLYNFPIVYGLINGFNLLSVNDARSDFWLKPSTSASKNSLIPHRFCWS